ncbi:hypothetical protein C8Q77DRAFT_1161920 [Trametes polyzona]|nr:hypothetical protein C8Q77DRAFT_1161920 [Trametes polyzona]
MESLPSAKSRSIRSTLLNISNRTTVSHSLTRARLSKMSYTAFASSYNYSSPASPNAFSLFGTAQSPRDTHHMCEDARQVLRSSNRRTHGTKTKSSGLKKIFGL